MTPFRNLDGSTALTIRRRGCRKIVFAAFCAVLFSFSAEAQQATKIPRIGYLSARDPTNDAARADAIRQGLHQLGYIGGQKIAIEYRYADGRRERFDGLISDLVRLKVDLIVIAGGDAPVRSAMNATKTIPIVMSGGGGDPVTLSLVENLACPGGNVTGITNLTGELGGKRLELLKQVIPKLHSCRRSLRAGESQQRDRNQRTSAGPSECDEIDFTAIRDTSCGRTRECIHGANQGTPRRALRFAWSVSEYASKKRIVELALKARLPSIYPRREYALEGGLMSYDADIAEGYRRVAYYIDRILKGAKPADLPVEQPIKFEMVINLKTAKQIGLTIPPNVLARADKVIR